MVYCRVKESINGFHVMEKFYYLSLYILKCHLHAHKRICQWMSFNLATVKFLAKIEVFWGLITQNRVLDRLGECLGESVLIILLLRGSWRLGLPL